MAKFYGIGTGPGDSELITVKGARLIGELDVLYTPEAKKKSKSLALSIVDPYLKDSLEIKQRHFPMTRVLEEKIDSWQQIAQEIEVDVTNGKNVGFITLGDPMVYSTYSYLLDVLKNKVETETIPGIASFVSMASSLEIPLVMDEETFSVIPATASAEAIANGLDGNDTIVLMKVANHLPTILPLLKERDLLEQTMLISNASMEKEECQKGISHLKSSAKISYFSTMIVYKNRKIK